LIRIAGVECRHYAVLTSFKSNRCAWRESRATPTTVTQGVYPLALRMRFPTGSFPGQSLLATPLADDRHHRPVRAVLPSDVAAAEERNAQVRERAGIDAVAVH
jgi:hypothetical protein